MELLKYLKELNAIYSKNRSKYESIIKKLDIIEVRENDGIPGAEYKKELYAELDALRTEYNRECNAVLRSASNDKDTFAILAHFKNLCYAGLSKNKRYANTFHKKLYEYELLKHKLLIKEL